MSIADSAVPRAVVVGVGYWGKNLARNLHDLGALVGICDTDLTILTEQASQYGGVRSYRHYDEVLSDKTVDVVVLASPAAAHESMAREALLAGKDVFVEKPLALSSAAGEKLASLAEEKDRILMVGHLLRYHPAVVKLKEMVDEGELGKIQYIYSNRLNLGKIRVEENILWSFAPHDISVILALLEEMPTGAHAQGGNYLHHDVADATVSLLSFRSGVRAHIFVSWLHPFKEQRLVVVGDRQMAVFSDTERDKLVVYPHSITWKRRSPVPEPADAISVDFDDTEPLQLECQHLLECVATRRPPLTDGWEGVRVLRVLEDCQAGLEGRRT